MEPDQSVENKREFPRIPKRMPIEINRLAFPMSDEPEGKGTGKNISQGGVCFSVPDRYEPGAILSLKMRLVGWSQHKKPHSYLVDIASEPDFTALGEVVWCRKHATQEQYDIGVKFVNIYEDDLKALMEYLKA